MFIFSPKVFLLSKLSVTKLRFNRSGFGLRMVNGEKPQLQETPLMQQAISVPQCEVVDKKENKKEKRGRL